MQFIAMQYIQPVFKQQRLLQKYSRLYKLNPMLENQPRTERYGF